MRRLAALLLTACGVVDDGTTVGVGSSTSSTSTSSSESSSSSTGAPLPVDCESALDEAACKAASDPNDTHRCQWVERFLASPPEMGNACSTTSLGPGCLEFVYQGNGCGWTPPIYPSCAAVQDEWILPWWFRLEGDELVYIVELCGWHPVELTQCWGDPSSDPAECECACLG
jgi:hypothetical protein